MALALHTRTVTCKAAGVAEWIYFIHPPRDDFAATMTPEEQSVWAQHFAHLQRLLADGVLIIAGPTLGTSNTGITVFDAADEEAARAVMASDPVIISGLATGELRPFRVSLLRGRT
jgi:uncharacterized protein YciI